jgi:hypothetical protein
MWRVNGTLKNDDFSHFTACVCCCVFLNSHSQREIKPTSIPTLALFACVRVDESLMEKYTDSVHGMTLLRLLALFKNNIYYCVCVCASKISVAFRFMPGICMVLALDICDFCM